MLNNSKSILCGMLCGGVVIFWIALYTREEKWELVDIDGKTKPGLRRGARSVESSPTPLTAADRAYLRRFGTQKLYQRYRPIFSPSEKEQVMTALRVLTDALDTAGITYFLYGGSLIGSWRHHDIVPWDDDLDIVVNISSWQALENLKIPGHTLNIRTLNRYKFYSDNATKIPSYFWSWPYIDVCFFGDNGTHLYDMDPAFSRSFVYDKEDILPLVRRPFGDLDLNTPKNTLKTLEQNYNLNICQTRSYNHKRQKGIAPKDITSVDCTLLYRLYPFVIRQSHPHNQIENVYLDGKLVKSRSIAHSTKSRSIAHSTSL